MNKVLNTKILPEGYKEIKHIDLTKQKSLALAVNGFSFGLAALTFVVGLFLHPLSIKTESVLNTILAFGIMLALLVLYIVLHEAVHGICIRIFSGERPYYGFTGGCAFAGSHYYYNRKSYVIIALSPIIFWGVVLAICCAVLPTQYFWVIYAVQILNISGGAGDLYVTWLINRLHKSVLVKDDGVSMTFFERG